MSTMKAVRIHKFGGPGELVYGDAPKPEPKDGEVLIRIAAAGVNPIDWKMAEGQIEKVVRHPLPLIPGRDAAGVVEALGPGAAGFAAGDAVFALTAMQRTGDGTYAEFITLPAETVCSKPASLGFAAAASVPLAASTAWQALFDEAGLQSGQTILVHGGGGAVGAYAVQFARVTGARVIATATGDEVEYVRSLGADTVVDYKTEKFEDFAKDADAVLDTVGGETQARSWATLKDGGVLVTIVGAPTEPSGAAERGVRSRYFDAHPDAADLTEIARLIDAGAVKPRVGATYPLSQARQAQETAKNGHTRGKIVLTM